MKTIQVLHRLPVTVSTAEVQLPIYFTLGKWAKRYCMMTEEFRYIEVSESNNADFLFMEVRQYDGENDASNKLEKCFIEDNYCDIDEAVFMHKFSLMQRQIHHSVFPLFKPNEEAK